MKKNGLFHVIIMLVVIAFAVAGCGGGAPAKPAESNDIKIGVVYELTGNTASFGTAANNGTKLAFKEINAAGGALIIKANRPNPPMR
jgi:branched-chain amino acid transport system substrate-binding protein